MAHNESLNPSLNLLINCIPAKSEPQILSVEDECTFLLLNFLIIGLCKSLLGIISFLIPLLAVFWSKNYTSPFPKICHTYPAVMKLGTVIPYLKKIQKIFELRDTSHGSCWRQQFFTGNQQILLYQEIHV